MADRIIQAVGMVFNDGQKPYAIRISRAYLESLANYWRNQSGFKYMKIYEIVNYRPKRKTGGQLHERGKQIGYITHKGMKLDYMGLEDSQKAKDYKQRHGL